MEFYEGCVGRIGSVKEVVREVESSDHCCGERGGCG